jgi:hypothetical protein
MIASTAEFTNADSDCCGARSGGISPSQIIHHVPLVAGYTSTTICADSRPQGKSTPWLRKSITSLPKQA